MGEHSGRVRLWVEAVDKGLNSPLTSSAGRLFDAAAAAAGSGGLSPLKVRLQCGWRGLQRRRRLESIQ